MEQNTPINQENITAEDYYKLIKESKFEEMNLIFNSINEGKSFEIVSKEVGRSNRETRNMFQLASYYFKKYGKIEKQNKVNIEEMLEELKIKIQKDEAFDVSLEKSSKKEIRNYRRKQNLKRFYTPQEWFKLLKQIKNEKHKFLIEFLLHTGSRINEARGVRITDIDFDREQIILRKTKGGIKKNRTIQISTYLVGRIKSYITSPQQ
jgi:integrase